MNSTIAQRLDRRLQSETSLVSFNPGGRLRIVLAYPNTYRVGMSNLGLQTIYRLLNDHPEVSCERAFFPDADDLAVHRRRRAPLLSLETQRPVADADLLAFSASFENDYPNILTMLDLAGLPLRAADRRRHEPIVAMGGATVSINPEPVADFLDVCCVGEGEELVGPLVEALLEAPSREALLERLAAAPGFYVPAYYTPRYAGLEHGNVAANPPPRSDGGGLGQGGGGGIGHSDGGGIRPGDGGGLGRGDSFPSFAGLDACAPAAATVHKVRAGFAGAASVAATSILTPETEFGDRALVEVARGCTKGCRYCWVGYNILPFRVHAVDDILEVAERWRPHTDRVGLVATALLDHPEIEAIAEGLRGRGFAVFSPSLIISTLQEPLLRAITESGQRSLTIAPETGSNRLRELIMKKITNDEILDKTRMIFRAGTQSLKNYIIIGLPGETQQDLQDLVDLAAEMRAIMIEEARKLARSRLGTITLSVNCLIPKPATPFQWVEQIRPREYRAKLRWLRRRIARLPNVKLDAMSPRMAEIQGILSRGDRRVAGLLEHLHRARSWSEAVRAWEAEGGSLDHFAYRAYSPTDPLPWAHLRTSASDAALKNQWRRARQIGVDEAA